MNLRTLRVIEYNKIVEMLTTFASSPMAKRKCQRIKPRKDLAMIEALQQETRDALRRLNTQGNLHLQGSRISALHSRDLRSRVSSPPLSCLMWPACLTWQPPPRDTARTRAPA